jgi:hypothetical protein
MFETRSEDALHSFGTSRELIIAELTGYALDKIEREMAIRKITDPGSEAFVMMMRSLGGFSQIIGQAINEEPEQKRNSLGIADNPAWWLWHVKVQCIEAVREKVQLALSSAPPEKPKKSILRRSAVKRLIRTGPSGFSKFSDFEPAIVRLPIGSMRIVEEQEVAR